MEHEQPPCNEGFELFCSEDEAVPTEPSGDKPSLAENQAKEPTTSQPSKGAKKTRSKNQNRITAKDKRKAATSGFESLKNKKKKVRFSRKVSCLVARQL